MTATGACLRRGLDTPAPSRLTRSYLYALRTPCQLLLIASRGLHTSMQRACHAFAPSVLEAGQSGALGTSQWVGCMFMQELAMHVL